jgi:hypothetical protein
MLTYLSRWTIGSPLLALMATVSLVVTAMAQDPTDRASRSYRVILFLAEDGAPRDVEIQRLKEVWREGEGAARLRELLATGEVRRLDEVTILPGRETPVIRLGEPDVSPRRSRRRRRSVRQGDDLSLR